MNNAAQPKPCENRYDKDEYTEWLYQQFGLDVSRKAEEDRYQNTMQYLSSQLMETPFWRILKSELRASDDKHKIEAHEGLLAPRSDELVIDTKSYDSALLKTWRLNVLAHDGVWPGPPQKGWITPENWFTSMRDLLRTQVLVKYLDGVAIVRDRIMDLATTGLGIHAEDHSEARDEGYYAVHINVYVPLRLPDNIAGGGTQAIPIEIQVSTQVKEVIQVLTHKLYEERRTQPPATTRWQWNFEDEEFTSNYLGHILHYVEGTIMRLRKMPKEAR